MSKSQPQATKTTHPSHSSGVAEVSTELLRGSIRFATIVLMVTAAAAPLVVVSTYIPISIANGAGMTTALTYVAATLILLVFAVGFAQMAKRITSTGAFYTFTTQGLGKKLGLSAGFTVMIAYSMIATAIQGGFGFFCSALISDYTGVDVPWYVCSIASLVLMYVISYFRVTLTGKVLGVALVLEVLVVLIVATAAVVQGGAEGQMPEVFNPAGWLTAPAVGIGFFLAFWSWIGFETTAIYGEETTDPKESVPRATYIAVITLGVFYTFTSYAAIVGFGSKANEQAVSLVDQYYFTLADMYTWPIIHTLMNVLVVTGFFACSFAFHNNAARYIYSLGRDGILPRRFGHTHATHKSPHIANGVQVLVAIVTILAFVLADADPLLQLGTWLPIFCTLSIIFVQFLVSLAVVRYFNQVGRRTTADYLKTLVAPVVGALAQLVVAVLLIINLPFLAGSNAVVVMGIPVYVFVIALGAWIYASWLKKNDPARYEEIGILREDEIEEIEEGFVDTELVHEAYKKHSPDYTE